MTRPRTRGTIAALAATGALIALAPLASARGTFDLRGSWQASGSGQSGVIKITTMSLSTGAFSGTSFGGMFRVKGRETGNRISFTQSEPGYVGTDTATLSAGSTRMVGGRWHDTNGSGGTWAARKVSGPPSHKPKHKPKRSQHEHHKHS